MAFLTRGPTSFAQHQASGALQSMEARVCASVAYSVPDTQYVRTGLNAGLGLLVFEEEVTDERALMP